MKRVLRSLLLPLLLASGCSRPAPEPARITDPPATATPVPAPVTPAPVTPAPALPAPTPKPTSKAAPVGPDGLTEWVSGLSGDPPGTQSNACPITSTTPVPLQVTFSKTEWHLHPSADQPFWVPAVTLTVCNPGATLQPTWIEFQSTGAFATTESLRLPLLAPGEGITPVRLYLSRGLPEAVMSLVKQGALPEPTVPITVGPKEQVLGSTVMGGPAGGHDWSYPAKPDLPLLRTLSLAESTDSTLYLYAPDASYHVTTSPSCLSAEGSVSVGGRHLALWLAKAGGEPVMVGEFGRYHLPGPRRWQVDDRPAIGLTFLRLPGEYTNCANGYIDEIWAYDHQSGRLFRPLMVTQEGDRIEASGNAKIGADGRLSTSFYSLTPESTGWTTKTYRWEGATQTWLFEAETKGLPGE